MPTLLVLQALRAGPDESYGQRLCESAGLASGTVHPILARLEVAGWVTSRWEDADPVAEGRPRRRYYRLTDAGADQAGRALAAARRRRPTGVGVARLLGDPS